MPTRNPTKKIPFFIQSSTINYLKGHLSFLDHSFTSKITNDMDLDEWEFFSDDFSEDRQKRTFQENRNSDSENFLYSGYILWPSPDSRKIIEANQALLDPILFESEMGTASESDEDEDDNNGGFNLWRWSSSGIGVICTAAVAAAATALCILLIGSQQRNKLRQNQNIRFPIFPDAKVAIFLVH